MQPRAPAVQRHTHLAARQSRQFVQRAGLGGAGVGGGEDAQAWLLLPGQRSAAGVSTPRRDLLQYVAQLAHARHGNEADEDVYPVAGGQLAPDLLKQ